MLYFIIHIDFTLAFPSYNSKLTKCYIFVMEEASNNIQYMQANFPCLQISHYNFLSVTLFLLISTDFHHQEQMQTK